MATKTALPNGNVAVNGAHKTQSHDQKMAIAPKRRKTAPKKVEDDGLMASLCTLICDHQIGTLSLGDRSQLDKSLTLRLQASQ